MEKRKLCVYSYLALLLYSIIFPFANAQEVQPKIKRKKAQTYLYEAMPLLRKAWFHGEKKAEQKAIILIKKAVKEDPNYADALAVLMKIYELQGRCEEAERLWGKIFFDLELKKRDQRSEHFCLVGLSELCEHYKTLPKISREENYQREQRNLIYLFDLGKKTMDDIQKHLHRYNDLTEKKKDAQAEMELKAILKLYPYHADTYYNLGTNYFYQRRWKEAILMFKKAASISPIFSGGSSTPWSYLGEIYFRLVNPKEALKYFEKHLKIRPDDGYIRSQTELIKEYLKATQK